MYQVTPDYITAMHKAIQHGQISGYIDNIPFNAADVLKGSAAISNQCADQNNVKLGAVFIGVLKITFVNDIVPRGTWINRKITIFWTQQINDETPALYEQIPCGVFNVYEANHAAEGIIVTAYDNMCLFDKPLQFTQISGTPYNILKVLADNCGAVLGQARAQIEALANGTEVFSLFPENDCSTHRDLLSWLSQAVGCFATVDRAGQLVLKSYNQIAVDTLAAVERFAGSKFSDFISFYSRITIKDLNTGETIEEAAVPSNGLTMDLGANPFLQYGLPETRKRQREAILQSLQGFYYTPFNSTFLGNPAFDLGDVITFTGGIAGAGVTCCLMAYNYVFNASYAARGFGQNPATQGAQSKGEKAAAGAGSKSAGNDLVFRQYTNADEYEILYGVKDTADDETILLTSMDLDMVKDGSVDVNTRVIFQDSFTALGETLNRPFNTIKRIIYKLDGDEIAAVPFMKGAPRLLNDSFNGEPYDTIEDYQTILNLAGGTRKTLSIYLELEGDTSKSYTTGRSGKPIKCTIDPLGVMVTVRGQGLAKEKAWTGLISLQDSINKIKIYGLDIAPLEDAINVDIQTPIIEALADEIAKQYISGLSIKNLSDSINITMVRPTFNITEEAGEYNIVTEEDENIITE